MKFWMAKINKNQFKKQKNEIKEDIHNLKITLEKSSNDTQMK